MEKCIEFIFLNFFIIISVKLRYTLVSHVPKKEINAL